MLKLKELFASLGAKDGRDDERRIVGAIEKVAAEQRNAQEELRNISELRTEALLADDDPTLDKLDRRAEALHRVLERCEFAMPELQSRLENARDRDADAERLRKYNAALEAAKAGRAALKKYPQLAKEIAAILKSIAIAEIAIIAANEDPASGKKPISGIEQEVRGLPGEGRSVVSEHITAPRWFYVDGGPVEDERVSLIHSKDGNRGVLDTQHDESHEFYGAGRRAYAVVKRRERIQEIDPGLGAFIPIPLAGSVSLPGFLPAQPAIWAPVGGDPLRHENDPAHVLAVVSRCETDDWKRSARDPRDRGYSTTSREFVDDDDLSEDALAVALGGM